MPYGKEWRSLRRTFDDGFSTEEALETHHEIQRIAVADFLQNIRRNPAELSKHLDLYVLSVVCR